MILHTRRWLQGPQSEVRRFTPWPSAFHLLFFAHISQENADAFSFAAQDIAARSALPFSVGLSRILRDIDSRYDPKGSARECISEGSAP
jgi:hypothetical protein